MVELVPDIGAAETDCAHADRYQPRASATVHLIYDPFDPPINAIVSVARRLQEFPIEVGGLPPGQPLPFPALAPEPVQD